MIRASSVLSQPEQLSLNQREARQFPAFVEFLKSRPNPMGQVLLDLEQAPWQQSDARTLEDLVLKHGAHDKQKVAFLAIAHNAAHFWSKANAINGEVSARMRSMFVREWTDCHGPSALEVIGKQGVHVIADAIAQIDADGAHTV
jgi:hypothetical protein